MKQQKTEEKRNKEILIVGEMIRLYCQKHHGGKELCQECQMLYDYAKMRVNHCPFMETKTFCSNCNVHCYKPQMREKIKTVMRDCGLRMLCHHPIMVIWHGICSFKEKMNTKSALDKRADRSVRERMIDKNDKNAIDSIIE